MGENTLTEIVLKDGDVVFFTPKTDRYGLAYFDICPVVRKGKLREIFIILRQQPDAKHYYRIPVEGSCSSWEVHGCGLRFGVSYPRAKRMFWGKEHNCHGMKFSVPPESNCFEVSLLTDVVLCFSYQDDKKLSKTL